MAASEPAPDAIGAVAGVVDGDWDMVGLPMPRNWDLGLRLQYQSGRPTTTTAGYNAAYGAGFFRFDFRVDKRAVWRNWLLDFYVDVTNAALLPEEVQPGAVLRYVLPTAGVRGRF